MLFYYPNIHNCIFKHSSSLSDSDFKPLTLLEGYKLPTKWTCNSFYAEQFSNIEV